MQSADTLKITTNNPAARIDVMTNTALQGRIAENKLILKQIFRILFTYKASLASFIFERCCNKLQSHDLDMLAAYSIIETSNLELQALRSNVDSYSQSIFQHTYKIAEQCEIDITMPRISKRQQHRSNPLHDQLC